MNTEFRRVNADIDIRALKQNFRTALEKTEGKAEVMAVVKANAYGHGTENVVPAAMEEGIRAFAVASLREAENIRELTDAWQKEYEPEGAKPMILVLGYTDPSEYERAILHKIDLAIYEIEQAKALRACVSDLRKRQGDPALKASVQIKLETGMQRIGFAPGKDSLETIQEIASMEELKIKGAFTHFARADEVSKEWADKQQNVFEDFLKELRQKGVVFPMTHSANSAAIMEYDHAFRENNPDGKKYSRAGIMIYGLYPSKEMDREKTHLEPVMTLTAHVIHVKDVPAGVPIGYGGTFVTDRPMKVATVSVGYGDGYPRALSNKGWMLIHGQKAPIVGRVCMDQTMVDVTNIPEAKVGDSVELFGKNLPLDDLAELCGTISYEIVCQLSLRVRRNIINP